VNTSVDYDVRRRDRGQEVEDDSRQVIKELRGDTHYEVIDEDEEDTTPHKVTGQLVTDPSGRTGAEPTGQSSLMQVGEFTCGRCFLICSSSRLARHEGGRPICRDCG
jgi:hypothetical protein